MSKRFDIHEWQAKIRLNELNETQPIVYTEPVFGPGGVPTKPVNAPGKISKNTKKSDKTAEQLDLSDNPKYMNAPVTKYNGLPIRDNVIDYASEILNQIEDYKNNRSYIDKNFEEIFFSPHRPYLWVIFSDLDKKLKISCLA